MLLKNDLKSLFLEKGIPEYRVKQVLQGIYKEGKSTFADVKVLPKNVKNLLTNSCKLYSFTVDREVSSGNGDTIKTLFKLKDDKLVEGVLMRFKDGRNSVCVSSQVGCGLKCGFCATGTMGFTRNLSAEEIADQVVYFNRYLLQKNKSRVTHVIFMGMGEPMLNYINVMSAVRIMNDPDYLGIAARHITISTSGVIPGIKKLMEEPLQINLALSLHAPNQELRESLMTIAKPYKLPELMKCISEYMDKTHRRISYEYVMLKDVNDSDENARELGELIRGQKCHVNLIPYNQTYLGFTNAGKSRIDHFREIVESYEIPVTVRVSLGQDINAACGQLAVKES